MNCLSLFFLGANKLKKIFFVLVAIISFSSYASSGDWSETHGGDGIVSEFIMIARSLVAEMEQDPITFDKEFTANLKQSINETIVSSADKLILNGIEKDAVNHTLEKPFQIEVSRNRWLQYESSIETQEKLVLHEYLFTLHIDDSDYIISNSLYRTLIGFRMSRSDDSRLGPYLLKGAENCNLVKTNSLMSLGVNLNYVDENNRNALFMAAYSGCEELVRKFLDLDVPDLMTKDSWSAWFATFVGSLKKENTPLQLKRYLNILSAFFGYNLDTDIVKGAIFNSNYFPAQENYCKGQTMFMRSLIGINFYTDESKSKTIVMRNLKVASLFKREGASLDLKDACGKTANDYAKMYNVDLKKL